MAESEAKKTYPTMPASLWWTLRKRFTQTIPPVVSDNYLATVLNIAENSVRANVRPALRSLGLVNPDGKATDLVTQWRDDETYPDVCKQIAQSVYPDDLLHGIPEPWTDTPKTEKWFANRTKVGENAARKMAALCTLLMEADPRKQDADRKSASSTAKRASTRSEPQTRKANSSAKPEPQPVHPAPERREVAEPIERKPPTKLIPDVNINLQIHISSDASPEQIEKIFESMSRYLYKND